MVKISRRNFLKATTAMSAGLVVASTVAGTGKRGLLKTITPEEAQAQSNPVQVFRTGGGGQETGPMWAYVQNGQIIRLRGMHQSPAQLAAYGPGWSITGASGTVYTQNIRNGHPAVTQKWLTLARRVYDPHRLKYPLQRVDWSPTNRNPQTRGQGKFVRITWDQAFATIASELNRAATLYGPSSIEQTYMSHTHPGQQAFSVNQPYRGVINRVLCAKYGGYTPEMHSPDSWEGWVYGGSTVWGYSWLEGLAPKSTIEDALQNSQLIVDWGHDKLGQTADANYAPFQTWFPNEGIRRIQISPDYNATAAAWSDNWIQLYPGTDASLAAAIAYVWISEGTYDKDYVKTHVFGFDQSSFPAGSAPNISFSAYILGQSDGVPKTPEWAEPLTGIPARKTRALAREWASKPTMVALGDGTICREPYGHEMTRYVACLCALQGLGAPGRGYFDGTTEPANPSSTWTKPTGGVTDEGWGNFSFVCNTLYLNNVQQFLWKSAWPWGILAADTNTTIDWYGSGWTGMKTPPPGVTPWFPAAGFIYPEEYCFIGAEDDGKGIPTTTASGKTVTGGLPPNTGNPAHYHYPMPGYSRIHVVWAAGSQKFGCWMGGEERVQAWQDQSLDFVFRVDNWWGGEAIFSDILLPACTYLERVDMMNSTELDQVGGYMLDAVVPPQWESMTDFDIEAGIADALGVLEQVHEGLDEMGWIQKYFNYCAESQLMTFSQFQNMTGTFPEGTLPTYFRYPWNPNGAKVTNPNNSTPGMRNFYNNPSANALDTKSGLLELYSQYIAEWFPDDTTERPPVPQARPSWECLQTQPLATKYPLIVDSPHPRFRFHTQFAENPWLAEIKQNRQILPDGYSYESLWMNPVDAAARGISNGDIIRVFNDRGQILCAAYLTERMIPGCVRSPDGGWYDPINPGVASSLDKGGCMNFLAPYRYQSTYASSFSVSAYLCEVEKYKGSLPVPQSVIQTEIAGGF